MNQTLTRRLAVTQATVQLLDSVSSVLSDLSDLQAHRAFRARVMEFIAAKHAEGECPADPLTACLPAVERAAAALDAARAQAEAWAAIDLPEGDRRTVKIGRAELDDVLSRVRGALRSFGDTAARLAAGFDAGEWAGGDLDGELLRLAGVLYPPDHLLGAAATDDRRGLFALATQASGVRESVVGHMRRVEAEALELIAAHDAEAAALRDAMAAAKAGSHLTARRIVGGLRGQFSELNYPEVETECGRWFAGIEELEKSWSANLVDLGRDPSPKVAIQILDAVDETARRIEQEARTKAGTEVGEELRSRVEKVRTEIDAQRAEWEAALRRHAWIIALAMVTLAAAVGFTLLVLRGIIITGRVEITSDPPGATILEGGVAKGQTPLKQVGTGVGERSYLLRKPGFLAKRLSGVVRANETAELSVRLAPQPAWTNSLGMVFVQIIEGERLLWSVWETRTKDYAVYARATSRDWKAVAGDDHPAGGMTWGDARAFCAWLTDKEQREGGLRSGWRYRLPTDHEWSVAVGIGDREDPSTSPASKSGEIKGLYPWGSQWPPENAGNYGQELGADSFENSAPVGSFPANIFGLFDMGGNVWEWCEDRCFSDDEVSAKRMEVIRAGYEVRTCYEDIRALRGASWKDVNGTSLLTSARFVEVSQFKPEGYGYENAGFRCVLSAPGSATGRMGGGTAVVPKGNNLAGPVPLSSREPCSVVRSEFQRAVEVPISETSPAAMIPRGGLPITTVAIGTNIVDVTPFRPDDF